MVPYLLVHPIQLCPDSAAPEQSSAPIQLPARPRSSNSMLAGALPGREDLVREHVQPRLPRPCSPVPATLRAPGLELIASAPCTSAVGASVAGRSSPATSRIALRSSVGASRVGRRASRRPVELTRGLVLRASSSPWPTSPASAPLQQVSCPRSLPPPGVPTVLYLVPYTNRT